jgi:hypothetical protein
MSRTVTLTPALLRRIVLEEKRKLQSELDVPAPEEVDADGYADTLAAHEDFTPKNESAAYRNLAMQERRLARQLRKIRESKAAIARRHR